MSNKTSSEVVFSGYLPIEVTDSDFRKAVERNENNGSKRKKQSPHKSMTSRIGGLLSSSRKKKGTAYNNNDSDRHSMSGFSNTGQQSVASKTVDSGTTIKASNLHQGQTGTKPVLVPISSTLMDADFRVSNAFVVYGGNRQQNSNSNNNNSSSSNNSKHIRPPKPWKSLKRFVVKGRNNNQQSPSITSQSSSDLNASGILFQRRHAKSHDGAELLSSKFPLKTSYPMRKRFHSEGVDAKPQQQRLGTMSFSGGSTRTSESQHAIDQVIRGRLDGIDALSLGPASRASLPVVASKAKARGDVTEQSPLKAPQDGSSSDNDNGGGESVPFDPLHSSFTNLQSQTSPAKLIDEMIWTSAGMDQPEIILEGYYPGGSDRWGVRIATLPPSPSEEQNRRDPSKGSKDDGDISTSLYISNLNTDNNDGDESTATNTTDNDGSTILPIAELWDSLWGSVATPPPIPSHMNMQTMIAVTAANVTSTIDCGNKEGNDLFPEDEENQQFASLCSVPIDLDDDAFIIDNPQHVQSVHQLVMVPLQARRFDSAISIFEKLQRGLDGNKKYIHLVASTSHNIGMIQLCQGNYREALESFRKAVEIRKKCLPADHPDIAVSLQREGMAYFALDSIVEALKCFEAALAICTSMDNARAKILNNIGVVRYQLEDYVHTLKSFTSALEIQRPWLEGPIRRESIVCSASTILSNIGKVYLREGYHDLAYFVFEEACLMQTSFFRKDHEIVLCSMDNMARAHAKNGNYAEALPIFTSLSRYQEARFGPNSAVCIETLGMMGIAHFKLLDYEEAEKCMKRVKTWQTHRGMDESHLSVKITTQQINQIKRYLQGKEPMWV